MSWLETASPWSLSTLAPPLSSVSALVTQSRSVSTTHLAPRSRARHGDIPNVQQNYSIREWNIFGRFKIFFRCTELYSTGTKLFYVWQYNFLNAIVHRSSIHPVKEWRSQLHTSLHLQYDISRSLSVSGGRARGGHLSPLAHGLGFSPSVIITSDTVRTQKYRATEARVTTLPYAATLWYCPFIVVSTTDDL